MKTELLPPVNALRAARWRAVYPEPGKNPVLQYLASKRTHGSRRTYADCLEKLARTLTAGVLGASDFAWFTLRYEHTNLLVAALAEVWAPSTVNKYLAALRGVLRQCFRLKLMTAEDYHNAVEVEGIPNDRKPRGRRLTAAEIKGLFRAAVADDTARGRRDAAIVTILYLAGLRRAELTGLDLGDYDPEQGRLHIRSGKGQKEGYAWIQAGGGRYLSGWIAARGDRSGALICRVDKADQIHVGRLADPHVFRILRRLGNTADLAPFSPHDLRYTFISDLLAAGADLAMVQRLARHKHPSTTAAYDRRGDQEAIQTAGLLRIPILGWARETEPKK